MDVEFFGHLVHGQHALFGFPVMYVPLGFGQHLGLARAVGLKGFVESGAELDPEFIWQFDLNLLHWS
jgi:hypothetical protein